jgi:hypothetical protein
LTSYFFRSHERSTKKVRAGGSYVPSVEARVGAGSAVRAFGAPALPARPPTLPPPSASREAYLRGTTLLGMKDVAVRPKSPFSVCSVFSVVKSALAVAAPPACRRHSG